MKKYLKNNKLIIFILIIPIFLISFFTPIEFGDEIINFQSTQKIVDGYKIYSDFNVITTPLFFDIGAIFFKLFGSNLFIYRIYNSFIFVFFVFSIYLCLKKMNISNKFSLLTSLCILSLFIPYIKVGANYNTLALALFVFGISFSNILELEDIKKIILQGTIIFLIFFTKQNIGIYYMLALILSNLIIYKGELKSKINNLIKVFSVAFIELIFTLGIMAIKGNLFDMINYAFLGMMDFTSDNLAMSINVKPIIYIYLISVFIIDILYLIMIKQKVVENEKAKSLIIFSLFLNLSIFPIINLYHTTYAILLNIIMVFEIIVSIITEYDIKFKDTKFMKIISKLVTLGNVIVFLAICLCCVDCGIRMKSYKLIKDKNSIYYNTFISENLYSKINNVCNYIKTENENGNKVIIFSEQAPLYMSELHKNNEDFDLPFKGNLGKNGVNKLILKINELSNYKILISNELYWQIPEDAIYEIKLKRKLDKNIEDFTIYEVK